MLLFFIAQMTALASNCEIDTINKSQMDYKVYICDSELGQDIEIAKDWWNDKGKSIEIVSYDYPCDRSPGFGEIFVEFNDKEVDELETETTRALAATTRIHSYDDTVISAKMFFSTSLRSRPDDLLTLAVHEMGHAIGYGHVSRSCDGHIMNPNLKYMGESF
tara:strand:+ start:793 stop:1278 length:486 start_codon:yes stop_codon:yes gene_type:complete